MVFVYRNNLTNNSQAIHFVVCKGKACLVPPTVTCITRPLLINILNFMFSLMHWILAFLAIPYPDNVATVCKHHHFWAVFLNVCGFGESNENFFIKALGRTGENPSMEMSQQKMYWYYSGDGAWGTMKARKTKPLFRCDNMTQLTE